MNSQSVVLGAALLDNELLRGPLAQLSVLDFAGGLYQDIYRTMLQLFEDGQSFDHLVLAEALKPTRHFKNGTEHAQHTTKPLARRTLRVCKSHTPVES
jgi:replicative DNA helicase